MARHAEPKWDQARRQWFAFVGPADARGKATRVRFPRVKEDGREATERDRAWAFGRMEAYLRERVRPVAAPGDGPTWCDVAEAYLADLEGRREAGRVTPHHYRVVVSHLTKLADAPVVRGGPQLGDMPTGRLTAADLDAVVMQLQSAGMSPHYVDGLCRSTMAMLNWATRPRPGKGPMIPANPFAGFKPATIPVSPERFAERPVAARWLRWLRDRANAHPAGGQARRFARSLLLLEWALVRTGARPGELCDLRWSDLKLDAGRNAAGVAFGRAVIPPSRWKTGGKTGKARTIWLYPPLVRALARLARVEGRHPTHAFVHGRGRGGKGAGEPWASGSVLSKTVARIRREAIAAQAWAAGAARDHGPAAPVRPGLARLAEVPFEAEGPNRIVNYLWRHTAASTLLMLGIDLATVAESLGTSVEMLRKNYGHIIDAHLQDAARRFAFRRRPGA